MNKEKIFKRILQILFFLSLISPLVVDRRLFFPYITGSSLFFRLVVEMLFFAWLIFILVYPHTLKGLFIFSTGKQKKDKGQSSEDFNDLKQGVGVYPQYRPKFNWLSGSFAIYLLVLTAATIFGSSAYLSLWGDAERMMGLFGMLYFFVLFLVGASIFGEKKELNFLLNVFLAVSTIVVIYGFLQRLGYTSISPGESRIFSMLGNASKLAAYLIFGLFFSAYLCLKNSKLLWRLIYGSIFFIHGLAIFLTGTRGAFLGLAVGFLFAFFAIVRGIKDKKLQRGLIGGLIFLVALYGFVFFSQNQNWVKNSPYLYRVVHFSSQDATIQGRLISWKAGWLGFKEKPLLGWGFENFTEPFNKYFDARYYNFAYEEYFDRAHNIVIEHLVTTGILGLAAYLFFLSAVFYYLIKIYEASQTHAFWSSRRWGGAKSAEAPLSGAEADKKEKNFIFFGVFGGLLIAYFVQNLFLFDSLPALLGFMVLLVVVDKSRQDLVVNDSPNQPPPVFKIRPALVFFVAIILAVIFYYSLNNLLIKPFKALKDSVAGQVLLFQPVKEQQQVYEQGINYLKKSGSYQTFLDLDLRTVAANTIYNYYTAVANSPNQKFDLDFAIGLHKQNLRYLPQDTYYNYKLAELLDFRYAVDLDERFRDEAKMYAEKAIATSPNRVTLYYVLMENLVMAGKFDAAIEVIQKAISLNDKMPASYWELTKAYYQKQDFAKAKEMFIKTINMGHHISEQNMDKFLPLFNVTKSDDNQIEFMELVVKNGTTNYLYYSTLANLYYKKGEYQKAIDYAEKSAELNPGTKEKVDKFIESARKLMQK